jgi:hypothetical protein
MGDFCMERVTAVGALDWSHIQVHEQLIFFEPFGNRDYIIV